MFDIKSWAEKAPVAVWTVFLYTVASACYGTIKMMVNSYGYVHARLYPDQVTALITNGDFQSPQFDTLIVNFNNATRETQDIDNVRIRCIMSNGAAMEVFPINDSPLATDLIKNVTQVPVSIKPGEPRNITLFFMKSKIGPELGKDCLSIRADWTDINRVSHSGYVYNFHGMESDFTNSILNKT